MMRMIDCMDTLTSANRIIYTPHLKVTTMRAIIATKMHVLQCKKECMDSSSLKNCSQYC